jgi:hypothetical protein
MPWLLFFALCVGVTQVIFVYNFMRTLHRKPTGEELTEYHALHKSSTSMKVNHIKGDVMISRRIANRNFESAIFLGYQAICFCF